MPFARTLPSFANLPWVVRGLPGLATLRSGTLEEAAATAMETTTLATDTPAAEPEAVKAKRSMRKATAEPWHMLQFSDAIDFELASALAATEASPVILWEPDRSVLPVRFGFREAEKRQPGSVLSVRRFPVMRGFARPGISVLSRTGSSLAARLQKGLRDASESVLVCTTPYFASVAEHWRGPVVYWLTDLIACYEGADPAQVRLLDSRMCRAATLVCPASERLSHYLQEEARCLPGKIEVLPNAARTSSLLPEPLLKPTGPPPGVERWNGPVAGVMGNLAENMDWVFLRDVMGRTPWLSWVFVGPGSYPIADAQQRAARAELQTNPQARFVGARPYAELVHFARAFDVAVLPYRRREPTYSGSSTRFYEHLAACHPMLATPCVAELEGKEPLLRLVPTAAAAAQALEELRRLNFQDGQRITRWEASLKNTWLKRAESMQSALVERLA